MSFKVVHAVRRFYTTLLPSTAEKSGMHCKDYPEIQLLAAKKGRKKAQQGLVKE